MLNKHFYCTITAPNKKQLLSNKSGSELIWHFPRCVRKFKVGKVNIVLVLNNRNWP